MTKLRNICLILSMFCKCGYGLEEDMTPFIKMSMVEIVRYYNYTITDYNLTTSDGYILQMFRLQNATTFNPSLNPVMFFHGLTGCMNNWFLLGRQSLPFLLADLGYDVWLPNSRGTFYGRRHKFLDPKSKEFWSFSWHQIAVYDMPASIDVVLNVTGFEKVSVIGHSQGSTVFIAMTSDLPEYDKKIAVGILMAPGLFFKYLRVKIWRTAAQFYRFYEWLADALQWNSVTPSNYPQALPLACNRGSIFWPFCSILIKTMFEDPEQLQPDTYPYMVSKVPCGGSVKEMLHYVQLVATGEFNHYDHGPEKNLLIYNSTKAPPYPLENIRSNVIVMHGPLDYASSTDDVKLLVSRLTNAVVYVEQPKYANWSHIDYLLAKDVYKEAYSRVITFLKRINKRPLARKRLVH